MSTLGRGRVFDLRLGDCLEVMGSIPDGSVDMVLADLPYGTTACKWDTVIPLEPLWEHYKRIIKRNGAIVLTASQPFTSALVMSNPEWFRCEWVWDKANHEIQVNPPLYIYANDYLAADSGLRMIKRIIDMLETPPERKERE